MRPPAALFALCAAAVPAGAIDNGLGRSPPMGWRGWLLFGTSPTQQKMEAVLPALVSRNRSVGGKPTSLCDLGYCSAGLDNNWNKCQSKMPGAEFAYHYNNGTPAVDTSRFPSMSSMTAMAHSLGLTVSWYGNNCGGCREKNATLAMYKGDVAALGEYGFDGIKLDGCGAEMDLDLWARLINATGRPVMIENCHWGKTLPNKTWCPFNFYRSSGDISVSYASAIKNMLTQLKPDKNTGVSAQDLSRSGCFAYPDNMVIGTQHYHADPLNEPESYTHFALWAITSSPLILSLDLNNQTAMDFAWPIISNKEAIGVNQVMFGESGNVFAQANATVDLARWTKGVPAWQFLSKAQGQGRVAVLLVNHGNTSRDLSVEFAAVPKLACAAHATSVGCAVRDIWAQKDLGTFKDGSFTASRLPPHGSAFVMVGSPSSSNVASQAEAKPSSMNVRVDFHVAAAAGQAPLRRGIVQAYNSGLVSLQRLRRDAHWLPLAGASQLRIDVGLGWRPNEPHMPAIFGGVVRNAGISSYNDSVIMEVTQLLQAYGVAPTYSWCYNPFNASGDFTAPVANLSAWHELHRLLATSLRRAQMTHPAGASTSVVHELYNEPDLGWAFRGSWQQYLAMAVAAAQGLRTGDPVARIVGPAVALPTAERLASMLVLVKNGTLPLSAITIHAYGGGTWRQHVSTTAQALRAASVRLPIHINELNVLSGDAPALEFNGYALAARALDTIYELLGVPEVGQVNWAQFMNSGAGDQFGLIDEQGRLKPSFHAFYIYARMPATRKRMIFDSNSSGVRGFASANATVATAALWSIVDVQVDVRMSLRFPAGFVMLRVFVVDSARYAVPVSCPIMPTEIRRLGPYEESVVWSGVVQPRATMFFEVVHEKHHSLKYY